MHIPRISIGLPVYNGGKYLRFALNSILSQTFTDFELIISDNASTDATQEICREHAAKDGRIRYYRNESNIGAAGNYNRVFELSSAGYFKWASHDDEFHSSLLEKCLKVFEQSPPSTVLAFSKAAIIDETGCVVDLSPDTIESSATQPFLRLGSLLYHAKYAHPLWGLIKSDALRRTRLLGNFEADHILLAELALLGECIEIPEVLYQERRHAGCAMNINRTSRELLAWYDPNRGHNKIHLPHRLHWNLEYFRAIRHIPLAKMNKLLCYFMVLAAPIWRWLLWRTGPLRHRIGLRRTKRSPSADPVRPKLEIETPKTLSDASNRCKKSTQ
jgi:glycosyltransferase involved in cell wall biosynthesis